jgi:hypothetical protein
MGNDKKKNGKKGGFGKLALITLVVLCAAGGAAWYFDPELCREQLDRLRGMFGG